MNETPKQGDVRTKQCATCEATIRSVFHEGDPGCHPQSRSYPDRWETDAHTIGSCVGELARRVKKLEAKKK